MSERGKSKYEPTFTACEPCALSEEGAVLRCDCGSLLARYVGGQLELKCRRCKRTVTVQLELTRDQENRTR
jgi:phage FluMu protein Com